MVTVLVLRTFTTAGLTTTTKSGGATARITVDASGTITAVKVMEGGSGYVLVTLWK